MYSLLLAIRQALSIYVCYVHHKGCSLCYIPILLNEHASQGNPGNKNRVGKSSASSLSTRLAQPVDIHPSQSILGTLAEEERAIEI